MRALIPAITATLLAATQVAFSQDSRGAYMGGSIGQAAYKHTCDGAPAGITCDNSDTAARVFAGYQFTRSFAMEIGYHNLGTVAARGSGPAGVTETAELSAIDFAYVGSWPIANRFSLLARLGLYLGKVDAKASATGRNWKTSRNNDITFGAGVGYVLTEHAEFRFEWQHFGHLSAGTTPALDIHLFSLAALYRF